MAAAEEKLCVLGALACAMLVLLLNARALIPAAAATASRPAANKSGPSIHGFYHVAMTGRWQAIVAEQMQQLRESGLLNATDRLHATVLLPPQAADTWWAEGEPLLPAKARATLLMQPTLWEYPALGQLYDHCSSSAAGGGGEGGYVYYFHTKGANSPDPLSARALGARDWRDAMQHFVMYGWRDCVRALNAGRVACGMNLHGVGSITHFSGNFWWASCDYVREHLRHPLRGPSEHFRRSFGKTWENGEWGPPERWYAEMWLLDSERGRSAGAAHGCFTTGTDHYNGRFDVSARLRAPGVRCATA